MLPGSLLCDFLVFYLKTIVKIMLATKIVFNYETRYFLILPFWFNLLFFCSCDIVLKCHIVICFFKCYEFFYFYYK